MCIYMYSNDAYVKTAAKKHPWLLGKASAVGWAEIWERYVPINLYYLIPTR